MSPEKLFRERAHRHIGTELGLNTEALPYRYAGEALGPCVGMA